MDTQSIGLLLSIGTGEAKISRFKDGTFGKYSGYWKAARKLASDSARVHGQLEGLKRVYGLPYYRFDVPREHSLAKIKLDEFKPDTLDKIEHITTKYCDEPRVREQLIEVANILVKQRRERAESDMWGLVSQGKQYRCTWPKCRRCQLLRPRKKDLESHLRVKHSLSGENLEKQLEQGVVPRTKPETSSAGLEI